MSKQDKNSEIIQENFKPIIIEEWNKLIYIEQGGQSIVIEKEKVKTLVSLLSKL